jgi:hypothetical protein
MVDKVKNIQLETHELRKEIEKNLEKELEIDKIENKPNSLSNRIQDVMNEQLNLLNPIDDLFSVPIIDLESSLSSISEPMFLNYITISKQFSKNYLFNNPQDILSVDEIAAINLYTREWDSPIYKLLNADLRKNDRAVLKKWFPYLRLLMSGLLKLPQVTEILWRGFNSDQDQESIYIQGRKIYWWGFSSCTLTANTVKSFLASNGSPYRNLFSIKCISGINIKKYSSLPDEDEILLLPGSYFEVKSILNLENNMKMFQLEQMKSQLSLHPKIPDLTQEKISWD